jgi:hypothetical protein
MDELTQIIKGDKGDGEVVAEIVAIRDEKIVPIAAKVTGGTVRPNGVVVIMIALEEDQSLPESDPFPDDFMAISEATFRRVTMSHLDKLSVQVRKLLEESRRTNAETL